MRVASLLMSVVRHSDVVARTGGEEFVVLMAHTDLAAAAACCERALAAIRAESWEDIAAGLTVTASVGIAGAGEAGASTTSPRSPTPGSTPPSAAAATASWLSSPSAAAPGPCRARA